MEATEPQFQPEVLSIEIRVCPAALLLEHGRLTHTPLIFSEVFSPEENFLLSLSQTDRIENYFETVGGPVPWYSLLNPVWDELLQCVEDSWL